VRLVGLGTDGLNGLQGVVSRQQPESGRYTVLMDDGTSKSIQPKNLEVVGGASPRGMPRGVPNLPGLSSPQVQEALHRAMEFIQPVLQALPMLQGPLGMGLIAVFMLLVWKAGLVRGVLVGGVIVVGLVNGLPHFQLAGGGLVGLRAAVKGLGTGLATQASRAVSYRINITPNMGIALFGLIVFGLVQVVFSGGDSIPSYSAVGGAEEAYTAGFRDGSTGLEYGTSKPISPSPVPSGSGGFGLSSLFSLGLLGKTGYDLGRTPNGWDPRVALQNSKALPPLQIALLSFLVVRLLGLSPI